MKLYSGLLLMSVTLFGCLEKDKNQSKSENNKQPANDKQGITTIIVKLNAEEKCIFNYTDTLFTHLTLYFSNPGNSDTIITRTVSSNYPFTLSYGVVLGNENGAFDSKLFTYLAYPDDTLTFRLKNKYFMELVSAKNSFYLNRFDSLIHTQGAIPRKKFQKFSDLEWKNYYTFLKTRHERIGILYDSLLKTGNLSEDSKSALDFSNEVNYSAGLVSPVWNKDVDLTKIRQYIDNELHFSEGIFQNIVYYTSSLSSIVGGFTKFKTFKAGRNRNDWMDVLKTSQDVNLGKLTNGFQIVCLREYPLKQDQRFKESMSAVKSNLQSNSEKAYIDSIYQNFTMRRSLASTAIDTVSDLSNKRFTWNSLVEEHKGKYILIDFWASWCAPCRAQFPALERIKEALGGWPIEFISLNLDKVQDDWTIASEAEKKYLAKNNFRIVTATKSELVKKLKIESIPRIVLIGKNSEMISDDFYHPAEPDFKNNLLRILKD